MKHIDVDCDSNRSWIQLIGVTDKYDIHFIQSKQRSRGSRNCNCGVYLDWRGSPKNCRLSEQDFTAQPAKATPPAQHNHSSRWTRDEFWRHNDLAVHVVVAAKSEHVKVIDSGLQVGYRRTSEHVAQFPLSTAELRKGTSNRWPRCKRHGLSSLLATRVKTILWRMKPWQYSLHNGTICTNINLILTLSRS